MKLNKLKVLKAIPTTKVRKKKLSFYVTEPEAEQLRTICSGRDISVSQLIREQVKQFLSNQQ